MPTPKSWKEQNDHISETDLEPPDPIYSSQECGNLTQPKTSPGLTSASQIATNFMKNLVSFNSEIENVDGIEEERLKRGTEIGLDPDANVYTLSSPPLNPTHCPYSHDKI